MKPGETTLSGEGAESSPAPNLSGGVNGPKQVDLDFGAVERASEAPTFKERHEAEMIRLRFDKSFQLTVLKIFLVTIALLVVYDAAAVHYSLDSRFSTILSVVTPIFSFLIGMGTQVEGGKRKN